MNCSIDSMLQFKACFCYACSCPNCTLSSQVLTVDARNHGHSAHSPDLTYEAMSNDLKHLLNQLHIGKCILIGHSMGGKTAMTTALSQVFSELSMCFNRKDKSQTFCSYFPFFINGSPVWWSVSSW